MPVEVGTNLLTREPGRILWSYETDGNGEATAFAFDGCLRLVSLSSFQLDGADDYDVTLLDEYGYDKLEGLGAGLTAAAANHIVLYVPFSLIPATVLSGSRELPLVVAGKMWLRVTGATANVTGTLELTTAAPPERLEALP